MKTSIIRSGKVTISSGLSVMKWLEKGGTLFSKSEVETESTLKL
jgi:hypothetical protein